MKSNIFSTQQSARLTHFLWAAADWIFPPECAGCEIPGTRWCQECDDGITVLQQPICPVCGTPNEDGIICYHCKTNPPPYQQLRSWGIYDIYLRKAIHALKYASNMGLAEPLSKHLVDLYHSNQWKADFIIAVPLSAKRLKERGYNQSLMLARFLSHQLQIPILKNALRRTRDTRTQVGLNAAERLKNVDKAFIADHQQVAGQSILLIDDVYTTGATINACAYALRQADADKIYALTLARAGLALHNQPIETSLPIDRTQPEVA